MLTNFERYYHNSVDISYGFKGHVHTGGYEVNIILKGSLEVVCADKVVNLNKGDMLLWDATIFHRNRVISKTPVEFISLYFQAESGSFPDNFLGSCHLSRSNSDLLNVLDEEIAENGGEITEAAMRLLDALILRTKDQLCPPSLSTDKWVAVYHDAVNLMNESTDRNLSIDEIARHCGVCATILKNTFAQYADKGVMEYFLDLRMERAKELLLQGKSSKEVASLLGFSSPSYFSQCFRRKNGCSAREFVK